MSIGKHLANINLFRGADGRHFVAFASVARELIDNRPSVNGGFHQLLDLIEEGCRNFRAGLPPHDA